MAPLHLQNQLSPYHGVQTSLGAAAAPLPCPSSHCAFGLGHKGCGGVGKVLGTPRLRACVPPVLCQPLQPCFTLLSPRRSPCLRVNEVPPSPRRWEYSFSSQHVRSAWTLLDLLDDAGYYCTVHVCHTTFVHWAEVGLLTPDAGSPAKTREGAGLCMPGRPHPASPRPGHPAHGKKQRGNS